MGIGAWILRFAQNDHERRKRRDAEDAEGFLACLAREMRQKTQRQFTEGFLDFAT